MPRSFTRCSLLRIAPVVVLCTLAVSGQAQEADKGLSEDFSTCLDQSGGTTFDMIACIDTELEEQDARLNQAYKAVIASLTAERKQQLQEAQRLWIKYRDANCGFYYDVDGGSLARVSAADCVLTMTAARASELESFIP